MIRAAKSEDVEEVASLYRDVMGARASVEVLADWFQRMVFEQPWASSELPALVAVESGRIVGFLGSHPRPLVFDGEPGMLACSGQLVVAPEARNRAAGAMLLRDYLAGPQELTITDGATPTVSEIWTRLGGRVAYPQSVEWFMPLRRRSLLSWLRDRRGRSVRNRAARAAARSLRRPLSRLPAPRLRDRELGSEEADCEPLDAAGLIEVLQGPLGRVRLRAGYDEPEALGWLLARVSAVTVRGELQARAVRDRDGRLAGAFMYYLVHGGVSPVVAMFAGEGARAGTVLDAALADAAEHGAAALYGRFNPLLGRALAERRCELRFAAPVLIHSRNERLVGLLGSSDAQLTRLDSEWWMGAHLEPSPGRSIG